MKLLRLFFDLRTIYFKQTWVQILYFYFLASIGVGVVTALGEDFLGIPQVVFTPLILLVIYSGLRSVLRTYLVDRLLSHHPKALAPLATIGLVETSINLAHNEADHIQPLLVEGDAQVFLVTFDYFTRTKHGRFLSKQVYYSVLDVKLKRRLPHLLFDSKVARSRQFKFLYLRAQQFDMKPAFTAVFDTYAPQSYTLDSLSFITPEVMEALLTARRYDIEILGDRLLLYGPLMEGAELANLVATGRQLAKELNDNIDTYFDERLEGAAKQTDVTPFARSLLRSPFKAFAAAGVCALITIGLIIGAIMTEGETRRVILTNEYSLVTYVLLVFQLGAGIKILRTNRQAEANFRELYQTTA